MKLFIGITDGDWYRFLSARPELDEVNFWQPGGSRLFRALAPGDPFLFKLHYPDHFIVGGGLFEHATLCPLDLAWEAFGERNGLATLDEMRSRLARLRHEPLDWRANYVIGCIVLRAPFFLPRDQWIPAPTDLKKNVVQGKTYDATSGTGAALWRAVQERLQANAGRAGVREIEGALWSEPRLVRQRLGQGAFRLLVTDTYERRCALSGEKALPVLQAAHIRPVTRDGAHRLDNGLLLRSDIHTLFDRGYVGVTPDYRIRVSRRLKDDFNNGEHYYALRGREIRLPRAPDDRPNREFLDWHASTIFLGD